MRVPFLIPMGTKSLVSQEILDEFDVKEINVATPVMSQMMYLQTENGIRIEVPESWDPVERDHFISTCHQAYMGLCLSKITQGKSAMLWNWNMLENCQRFLSSIPIDRAKPLAHKDRALIVGNGPSLADLENVPSNVAVFSCWHASKKLIDRGIHIDYLCHCDAEPFPETEKVAKYTDLDWDTEFIATPNVHPSFTAMTNARRLYGYFGQDVPLNGFFCEKHKCPDHEAVHTTIASLMVSAALYMGFKSIGLIGIDHAWLNPAEPYQDAEEWEKLTNKHGVEVCTYPPFKNAAHGLYTRTVLRPDAKYYQCTKNALDIEGYDYMSLEEFLNAEH